MLIDEIVTSIEQRLLLAADEVAQLERARDALTDARPPEPAPSPPTRSRARAGTASKRSPAAKRAPAAKRTAETVPLPKLIALLEDSEGLSTRELVAQSGGSSAQILSLLKEREVAGDVRRSGTRATTRWHVITDEDRIAARAAELAAQSRSKS